MQATELIIGNYVRAINSDTLIVTSIENIGCIRGNVVEACDDIEYGYHIEQLTGIPLTEEWLVKAGFYQLPHFTVGNNWIKDFGLSSQISISCLGTPNLMVHLCSVDKDEDMKPINITDIVTVWNWDVNKDLSVHQLQNLYFSLTSKELF